MNTLSRSELYAALGELDAAVEADPQVDPFCTRSDWQLSFHEAFHPERELAAARAGGAFALLTAADGVLQPLEAMWGFAAALVGADSPALLLELCEARARERARELLYLSGLPPRSARTRELIVRLESRYALGVGSVTERFLARLDQRDGYLSRRSAKFRTGLRAAERRVRAAGVTFEMIAPRSTEAALAAYARVLAVERRSWKAATDNGVDRGPMCAFYGRMFPRLAERGALRVLFALRDGADVGYLSGGLAGSGFRGLQFSFDDRLRALGLGNVLQLEAITRLCDAGIASYDLGSGSAYKARWAEERVLTLALVARPRG
ncbi:MAG TPA: GNAT family N-acetyltransferase [Myxococcota bacterium]|nr:GNAT family N-acetyltransferase [Myxococcota bacterium]